MQARNKHIFAVFWLSILFLLPVFLHSQTLYPQRLNAGNGLPSNAVRAFCPDTTGLMWIGTDAGLCQYDGEKIEVFTTRDGLSGNKIWSANKDTAGRLWVGCNDGGISYRDADGFRELSLEDSVSDKIRCAAYLPGDDCMGFGTEDGIIVHQNNELLYYNHFPDDSIKQHQIISVQKTDNALIFYSYYNMPAIIYYPDKQEFALFEGNKDYNYALAFSAVFSDLGDSLLCEGGKDLVIFKDGKKIRYPQIGMVTATAVDAEENIWLASWDISQAGSQGGFYKYNGDTLLDYTSNLGIKSRSLWTVCYDSLSDAIWIGTTENGALVLQNEMFTYFPLTRVELKINDIKRIGDTLWVAADDSLYLFADNKQIAGFGKSHFTGLVPAKEKAKDYTGGLFNREDNRLLINCINQDAEGNIYLAGNAGFFQVKSFQPLRFEYLGFIRYPFVFIDNDLYSVGWSMLKKHERANALKSHTRFSEINYPRDVHKIKTHNGLVWFLSYNHSLFVYDEGDFISLKNEDNKLDFNIKDMCFGNDKRLYIAQNNGIVLIADYHSKNLHIQDSISEKTGLHGDVIHWLEVVGNALLVGTEKGLNLIKMNGGKRVHFFADQEGFNAFESHISLVDDNGNVWVNYKHGLMKIKRDIVNLTYRKPVCFISRVINHNGSESKMHESAFQTYRYDENDLSFGFNSANYMNRDKDVYYYRLKGLDLQWNRATERQQVHYYNLQPGNYVFQVKCFNQHAACFSEPASYQFRIMKPWWNTTVFYVLTASFFVFITLLVIWLLVRNVKRKEKRKTQISKKIAELEMKALQAQMNPHFVFNSLTAIQNFVLDNNTDEAIRYLSYFSSLLRNVLKHASKKQISLKEELDFLEEYVALEKMRFDNAFEVNFELDERINPEYTMVPPMLIQPLIENSIKHGQVHKVKNGKIDLKFHSEDNMLVCTVTDNGIGMVSSMEKKNKLHESKGLSLIQERNKLFSADLAGSMDIIELNPGLSVTVKIALKTR